MSIAEQVTKTILAEPCGRCTRGELTLPHRCPYQVEINDNMDGDFCNCCSECEQNCRDDV